MVLFSTFLSFIVFYSLEKFVVCKIDSIADSRKKVAFKNWNLLFETKWYDILNEKNCHCLIILYCYFNGKLVTKRWHCLFSFFSLSDWYNNSIQFFFAYIRLRFLEIKEKKAKSSQLKSVSQAAAYIRWIAFKRRQIGVVIGYKLLFFV